MFIIIISNPNLVIVDEYENLEKISQKENKRLRHKLEFTAIIT